jgi:hypothetical protein
MNAMKAALRSLLMQTTGVWALAGSRINWVAHPQGEPLPGVVLTLVSDVETLTLDGPAGLSARRVQVDCYADTAKIAGDLADAIRTRLSGYRGGSFRLIEFVTASDTREGSSNEATRPFRVRMDFIAHWRAS